MLPLVGGRNQKDAFDRLDFFDVNFPGPGSVAHLKLPQEGFMLDVQLMFSAKTTTWVIEASENARDCHSINQRAFPLQAPIERNFTFHRGCNKSRSETT